MSPKAWFLVLALLCLFQSTTAQETVETVSSTSSPSRIPSSNALSTTTAALSTRVSTPITQTSTPSTGASTPSNQTSTPSPGASSSSTGASTPSNQTSTPSTGASSSTGASTPSIQTSTVSTGASTASTGAFSSSTGASAMSTQTSTKASSPAPTSTMATFQPSVPTTIIDVSTTDKSEKGACANAPATLGPPLEESNNTYFVWAIVATALGVLFLGFAITVGIILLVSKRRRTRNRKPNTDQQYSSLELSLLEQTQDSSNTERDSEESSITAVSVNPRPSDEYEIESTQGKCTYTSENKTTDVFNNNTVFEDTARPEPEESTEKFKDESQIGYDSAALKSKSTQSTTCKTAVAINSEKPPIYSVTLSPI